ncbi:hypothetical protein [Methylogaea oryzae]|uniref:hypothetical protein n=1 Tax=Methylogaea oryzae TaxID=1295382 RepID=UPI001C81F38C|nr:hypothetical protein [Methylogaea oryzae]
MSNNATSPKRAFLPPPRRERGTLLELNILGVLLAVAGVALAGTHPGFLLLAALGIALPLLPAALALGDAWRRAWAARRRWRALRQAGFDAAAAVRVKWGEGGAYVGVDGKAGKLAFVTGDACQVVDFAQVKSVRLERYTVSQWGHPERTRYGFRVVLAEEAHSFGLSYPGKRRARRAFAALRRAAAGRLPFDEGAAW